MRLASNIIKSSSLLQCIGLALACLIASPILLAQDPATGLSAGAFTPLPLGAVKPRGWLREQLIVQSAGLTGRLDQVWPDIGESGWIGGSAEGWERMPYWLDGALPLAYQTNDAKLQSRIEGYLDYILEHQSEDGWLGPEKSPEDKYKPRDPWPVFVMLKVLTQYAEVTGDPRVMPAMTRFFRCLDSQLDQRPLFDWNRMRWQDGVLSVFWLYERQPEPWLLSLARKLHRQGYDWIGHFRDLPHKTKVTRWEHESHVVNNAMGTKSAALIWRMNPLEELAGAVLHAVEVLDRYHGQATGVFSGDECFAGLMPSQGTETCAVVEYMFSLEQAVAVTGEARLADRLEKIAFNALPAAVKADWWARQYVQQANQVVVRTSPDRIYTTNGEDANLFGFETNFGCCTANMHQGWPKFVSSLWMATHDEGLAAVAYAPSEVRTHVRGTAVRVEVATDYPIEGRLIFYVEAEQPVEFPLYLRIPAWAEGASLKSADADQPQALAAGRFARISRLWSGATRLELSLPMRIQTEPRFNHSIAVTRGPLVFSLVVDEEWRQAGGEPPMADWEVLPRTPWNYALKIDPDRPEADLEVNRSGNWPCPFCPGAVPIRLSGQGRRLPEWQLIRNAAAPPPAGPIRSESPLEAVHLAPYGTIRLRVTEIPVLND